MIEKTLPHFETIRRLASGGMGEVILAKERRPGGIERIVVVKRVLEHLRGEADMIRMMLDEARLSMVLQHVNIVQVLDVGLDDGLPYITMEVLEGCDVRTIIASSVGNELPLRAEVACAIGAGAARGLHYAHARCDTSGKPLHVVHRDISPHNLFVTPDGIVKVLDFGIARSEAQIAHTQTGSIKGKNGYMSPEQVSAKPLDASSDIYSLGVVIWECLTARRLWKREHMVATAMAMLNESVDPPSRYNPTVTEELDRLVVQMLAVDPLARPATARDVADTLDDILTRLGCASPAKVLAATVAVIAPESPLTASVVPDKPTVVSRPQHMGGSGVAGIAPGDGAAVAADVPATDAPLTARRRMLTEPPPSRMGKRVAIVLATAIACFLVGVGLRRAGDSGLFGAASSPRSRLAVTTERADVPPTPAPPVAPAVVIATPVPQVVAPAAAPAAATPSDTEPSTTPASRRGAHRRTHDTPRRRYREINGL